MCPIAYVPALMLRSANLESRQSGGEEHVEFVGDAPLREFGIKAKLRVREGRCAHRCSAPRIWNQGKALTKHTTFFPRMLRSANLESRQSPSEEIAFAVSDAPLREFGIKAKL